MMTLTMETVSFKRFYLLHYISTLCSRLVNSIHMPDVFDSVHSSPILNVAQMSSHSPPCGVWWLSGRACALRLEGRRFESHSSCHVGTLSNSLTCSCLWCFGVLTPTQYQCCSRERLSVVVDLKRRYRNIWGAVHKVRHAIFGQF